MSRTAGSASAGTEFHVGVREAAGAVADLGVLVPLAAALMLVNGLDAGSVLLFAGLLVLGAGAAFKIPFPVQPLKALTAVAVAQQLSHLRRVLCQRETRAAPVRRST